MRAPGAAAATRHALSPDPVLRAGAGSGLQVQQLLRRQIQVEERLLRPLGNVDSRVPLCCAVRLYCSLT